MSVTLAQVRGVLENVKDPATGLSLAVGLKDDQIQLTGETAQVELTLGYHPADRGQAVKDLAQHALSDIGVSQPRVHVTTRVIAHAVQPGVPLLANVRNIIAVASGKGGVGKSTTSVNLALALQANGARVGVLDADIYGPSIPMMLGVSGRPESTDGKTMAALVGHGIQTNSIGFLIDADSPAIWRGPMVTQALEQLLRQTNWNDLDYLIVDMPPGTGDIALTLSQKVPVVGAVIVTTPQDIALLDARKGLKMFEKVGVPILGIVENMAIHICSNCGHAEHIFGQGGGQKMASEYKVPWLGSLPLSMSIRVQADSGSPTVISEPQGEPARLYRDIANRLACRIATLPKDMSAKFPTVVVKRDK